MSAALVDKHAARSAGPLIDITRPEFKANPFPYYANLRDREPVSRARMGRMEGWLVTRYDDVLAALKDPRFGKDVRRVQSSAALSKRPWMPDFLRAMECNMLDQDDPNHARLRALVHRAFTPARIERLRSRIVTLAGELLDKVQAQGELELIRDFALPLPLTVIGELLGVSAEDRVRFQRDVYKRQSFHSVQSDSWSPTNNSGTVQEGDSPFSWNQTRTRPETSWVGQCCSRAAGGIFLA